MISKKGDAHSHIREKAGVVLTEVKGTIYYLGNAGFVMECFIEKSPKESGGWFA